MQENGDRLLKNIYTLWKINIFQLKFVSDRDYPKKVTEVVVSGNFGDVCLQRSLSPVENKMAEGKYSVPAQQMESSG